ncbi:carbamate kinase [Proteiniclasticum sp. SCR006]|uniref:Carbamate kinase n=1 Tax=Proteiniclasticum aestuarii TaxID=2817862 RepID=A0A939HAG6_9CLOT|nr:carbamate kinase [Proteiniclasticum aestuarii]MBO1264020.1 carbamate kinase [Proteiniclasticum aestuarii]
MSRILIALGGNALGNSSSEQLQLLKAAVVPITDLIEKGHEVIITHGNGPQVGMIHDALTSHDMPLAECTAMSQGYIGFHLQNVLKSELARRSIDKEVVSLVTQVVVDEHDEAFRNPQKPIGPFLTLEEAEELERRNGYPFIEDSGRGYRRVVPSPEPLDIMEKESVSTLLDKGHIVITGGGGGIPVIRKGVECVGAEGVIDKDYSSGKLAELIDCDYIFMLTGVDRVAINFGKKNQENLSSMSTEEARTHIQADQFPPGSMLPKVVTGIRFAESGKNRKAIIGSLEKTTEALVGKSGTIIYCMEA